MVSQDNETRSRILRAAEAEFAVRGFDGARVDAIAGRAGVNKALLYYYFQSKAGVLDALFEEFFVDLAAARARVPRPEAVHPSDFWAGLVRELGDFTRRRLDLLRVVVLEELKSQPGEDRLARRWRQEWKAAVAGDPNLPRPDQAVFNFFFEDLTMVVFQLMNGKWSRAMGVDPAESERQFYDLFRRQSDAYWSRDVSGAV